MDHLMIVCLAFIVPFFTQDGSLVAVGLARLRSIAVGKMLSQGVAEPNCACCVKSTASVS